MHFLNRSILFFVLALYIAVPVKAAPDGSAQKDSLNALFDYAKAICKRSQQSDTSQISMPNKFLYHPYSKKSLARRVMAIVQNQVRPIDIENALLDEIRDAKYVESVLSNSGKGEERLRALAEIHPFTVLSREEFEVLAAILRELVRAGYSRDQVLCVVNLIHELQPFLVMNSKFPTINSKLLEIERACLLARHQKFDSTKAQEILAIVESDPFNSDALYGAACLFTLIDRLEPAKNLLERAALIDPTILENVKRDPDLAPLRKDNIWFERFLTGKARPPIEPAPHPGVNRVFLAYNWSGLGNQISEDRTLIWSRDRFIDQSTKIEVPAWLIQLLLKCTADARPSDSLQKRITHFDDYPTLKVTLERSEGGKLLLFSNSNTPDMLPINLADSKGLKVTNAHLIGRALHYLLNLLGIKKGTPVASFHFGGTEIPKGDTRRPPSPEEIKFREEAGLSKEPAAPEPEPLPSELANLPGVSSYLGGTYVLGRDGNSAVDVDYYMVAPKQPDVGFTVNLIRARRGTENIWYPESPDAFYAHAAKAWSCLQKALGSGVNECKFQPHIRSIDEEGFPSTMDLAESVSLASRLGIELSTFGQSPIPTEVIAQGNALQIDGWFLLGSGTIYCDDLEFIAPPFDHRLAGQLISWSGIGNENLQNVKKLMLRNNMIYIDFAASVGESEREAMKKNVATAGRTIEEAKSKGYIRWMVKPASATEYLHVVIEPAGTAEFRSR